MRKPKYSSNTSGTDTETSINKKLEAELQKDLIHSVFKDIRNLNKRDKIAGFDTSFKEAEEYGGISIEQRDPLGETFLLCAVHSGNSEVAEHLIENYNACVTAVDKYNDNILHWGVKTRQVSFVKYLFKNRLISDFVDPKKYL